MMFNKNKEKAYIDSITGKWYATKEEAEMIKQDYEDQYLQKMEQCVDDEEDMDKMKQLQHIFKKMQQIKKMPTAIKPQQVDANGNVVEEDEEDGDEPTVTEKILDSIIDAFQQGATPDWLILKGDRASKAAARAWVNAQKRIEARRVAAEKAKRKAELREQALGKLSDEEKAALGIKV